MTDGIKAFILGIFVLAAIGLAAWLTLFLEPSVGDGAVKLRVRFANIDKINTGTRVTFAGRPVGEISRITEVPNPREAPADQFGNLYIFELELKVDSSVQVYTYDEISFATSGLLGEKTIAIMPRAAPYGAPPPRQITDEILYASSADKLETTLSKIAQVADTFEDTMGGVSSFLQGNSENFRNALTSFTQLSENVQSFAGHAQSFFVEAQDQKLISRLGSGVDSIQIVTNQIGNGDGSLGRLLSSDSMYVQLTTVLCQLQVILQDIRTYGILYQFDRRWQRMQSCCTEMRPAG